MKRIFEEILGRLFGRRKEKTNHRDINVYLEPVSQPVSQPVNQQPDFKEFRLFEAPKPRERKEVPSRITWSELVKRNNEVNKYLDVQLKVHLN